MEGPLSLPKPDPRRGRGTLYFSMFLIGAGLEYSMCTSGFYTSINNYEAKVEAQKIMEQQQFWDRVEARREKKARGCHFQLSAEDKGQNLMSLRLPWVKVFAHVERFLIFIESVVLLSLSFSSTVSTAMDVSSPSSSDSSYLPSSSSDVPDVLDPSKSWFNLDSPVLETDVGLVHLCFVASCLAIILFRSSSQGFSPRTQLLLWMSFTCNLLLKKLTLGYWWTWFLVGFQSLLCLLFFPSLRKQGVLVPTNATEKLVMLFISICCGLVGYIHYEKTMINNVNSNLSSSNNYNRSMSSNLNGNTNMQQVNNSKVSSTLQYLTPYMSSFYGLIGDEGFHSNSRNALAMAHNESILRSSPGLIAFLVGFKRSLEGLAILPQYRNSLFVDGILDWRVYSWTLSLGLYHLSLASMYFGKLHIITLTQCLCWIGFVLLAGGKIGIKAKNDLNNGELSSFDSGMGMKKSSNFNSYFGTKDSGGEYERTGLMDDDVMEIL